MSRWRPVTATIVSLLGLAVATYLTYSHYSNPSESLLTCPGGGLGGGAIDCQAVLTSGYSTIFGLPVALYGAVFFLFMTFMNLPVMWHSQSLLVARLRLAAAAAGMAMVLYLVSIELLEVHKICIWCTSVHVLQFILFLLVITGWYDTGWAASGWEANEPDLGPSDRLSADPGTSAPRRTATG
jgi:uncharacterized membrane protein